MIVSLREITAGTVRAINRLDVKPEQRGQVARNSESLAQALFTPEAWYRAIYADDEPVGFVMLHDESLRAPPPAVRARIAQVWYKRSRDRHVGHRSVGALHRRSIAGV